MMKACPARLGAHSQKVRSTEPSEGAIVKNEKSIKNDCVQHLAFPLAPRCRKNNQYQKIS
jgi:hypothetical protein